MNNLFIFAFCITVIIPFVILTYSLIPKIANRMEKQKYQRLDEENSRKVVLKYLAAIPFPHKWKDFIISKISESGIGDSYTWIYWIGITFFLPIIIFFVMMIRKDSITASIALCVQCAVLPNLYLNRKIENRKRAFAINAYKLYYFLHSQISSGIKVTDAVKGLHEIADHMLIKKSFIQFVAKYELTLNIEESLQILRNSFSGYDCEMLCVSIQQCVNTGMAGKTLLKMEQVMFAKYFFYLQQDTEKFKTKLLISGIFVIAPLIMIFVFPLIYDAFKAFGQIMKTS